MKLAIAFLAAGFLCLTVGVALFSIPLGVVVAGLLLAGVGLALLPTGGSSA